MSSALFWILIALMVLGLLLAVLFMVLWGAGKSRARQAQAAPPGPGFLIGSLLALLLLIIVPGVLLLVLPRGATFGDGGGSAGNVSETNRNLAQMLGNGSRTGSNNGGANDGGSGGQGGKPDDGGAGTPDEGGPTPVDGGGAAGGEGGGGSAANPELASRLSAAVDIMRRQLPMRSGPTNITSVEARGTQLVLNATIDLAVPAGQWNAMDAALTAQVCGGEFAQVITMGGSAVINLRDSSGQTHATYVNRCP